MNPTVSFAVTCYNFEPYIGECLASILAQRGTDDFEIIVIDDASTDNSAAVIRSFTDPRIRFVPHAANHGAVPSRLESLALVRGAYIAYTAGDDRFRPYFLERVLPIMRAYPDLGMVYGDAAQINSCGELVAEVWSGIRSRTVHQGQDFRGDEFLALLCENFIPIPTVLIRQEALQEIMPLRSDLAFLDWYMNLHLARRYELYYLAETLAEYRLHGKNQHLGLAHQPAYRETVLRIFDEMFNSPERASETSKMRARVYAETYQAFGDRAFALNRMIDARADYLTALRHQPRLLLQPSLVRHLLGTWLGPARYEQAKSLLQRSPNP